MQVNEQSKLSIIIPTYNRLERIQKTLPINLSNKRTDIEFVICDNASTDRTYLFLQQISKSDNRVKIFQNDKNVGVSKNIYRCFLESSSPYVLALGDDDEMTPGYIDLIIDTIEKNPEVGIIHYANSELEKMSLLDQSTKFLPGWEGVFNLFLALGSMPGLVIKKKCVPSSYWKTEDTIYPHVWACGCALLHCASMYLVEKEYVLIHKHNQSDSLEIVSKSRPPDFGVFERMECAKIMCQSFEKSYDKFSILRLRMFRWVGLLINNFYQESGWRRAVQYLNVMKNHVDSRGSWIFWIAVSSYIIRCQWPFYMKVSFFIRMGTNLGSNCWRIEFWRSLSFFIRNIGYLYDLLRIKRRRVKRFQCNDGKNKTNLKK